MRDSTTSKEKILKKIRKALIHKSTQEIGDVDKDSEIFTASEESLEMQFAQNFTTLNGKFIFCENEAEFLENFDWIVKDNEWKNLFCLEPKLSNKKKYGKTEFKKVIKFLSIDKIDPTIGCSK